MWIHQKRRNSYRCDVTQQVFIICTIASELGFEWSRLCPDVGAMWKNGETHSFVVKHQCRKSFPTSFVPSDQSIFSCFLTSWQKRLPVTNASRLHVCTVRLLIACFIELAVPKSMGNRHPCRRATERRLSNQGSPRQAPDRFPSTTDLPGDIVIVPSLPVLERRSMQHLDSVPAIVLSTSAHNTLQIGSWRWNMLSLGSDCYLQLSSVELCRLWFR